MNLSFRQLTLFLSLAELRSITAVARVFHVTQPTVSMQLRELTESVGLPLYEMIGKRLFLTAAGEELAKTARSMVDDWSAYQQRIAAMKGLTRGRLRVAVVSTAKYFVPRLLGTFCHEHPDIDIALEVLNRDGVLQRLRDNLDDLYIMSIPPKDVDIEQQILLPNPLVVIAPLTHTLAQEKNIPLSTLASERFILRERGSGTRLACDDYFISQQFQPRVRLELGSNEAIKQAVAGGLGLAVVSQHALGDHLLDQSLTVLDVEGFPIHSSWYTVYVQGKRLSPIAKAFLDYLSAQAWNRTI
ncbi:LysR family transcriptional regulator [soil metagenome]